MVSENLIESVGFHNIQQHTKQEYVNNPFESIAVHRIPCVCDVLEVSGKVEWRNGKE